MPADSTDRPRSGRRRQQQSGLGLGSGLGGRLKARVGAEFVSTWSPEARRPPGGMRSSGEWEGSRREEEEVEEERGRRGRKGAGGKEKRSKGVRHSLGLGLQRLPELGRALHLGKACAHLGSPQGRRLLATPALPAWEKLGAENSLPFLPFPPFLVLSLCGRCRELLLLPRPDG